MFKSFFPSPKLFFLSVLVYSGICVAVWYGFREQMGAMLGFDLSPAAPVIGLGHFVTDGFLLFYLYYIACTALFAWVWFKLANHPWQWWSIVGSATILFSSYFSVQVSVAINNWRRPFFDAVQRMLQQAAEGTSLENLPPLPAETIASHKAELYHLILLFAEIAFVAIFVYAMTRFLTSHFVFRWRTALNDYYTGQWRTVRNIEGASQRIQEDTMRFADIMENLGVSVVESVMTLFAFLPILWSLSKYVTELPIVGSIPQPLFWAALLWAIFGTGFLALVGIKLPGLYFKNQRVEAAFRKELVHGEDDYNRAQPPTLRELFENVRKNYFTIYFHYMYFNVARMFYLQADVIFVYVLMVPTIAVGAITFGILQQIIAAFNQVSNSFQYLVNSWNTIIELLSIHKRLKSFEAAIRQEPLPAIEEPAT
ncbi:MAG: peptide antibiotic transporter SbmA [Gammaproteobacteria bacterium]|jgi:peptide/bleomycin uptake transporter